MVILTEMNNNQTHVKVSSEVTSEEQNNIIHVKGLSNEIIEKNVNGSVLVLILKCDTKSNDDNINNLQWVFSDPYFITEIFPIVPSPNDDIKYPENYAMNKALIYAAEGPYITNDNVIEKQYLWKNLPVIIVKDSSVCNITPSGITDYNKSIIGGMTQRIKTALEKAPTANLYFLCRWNDYCNKNKQVADAENIAHGSSLKWSVNPTATQAIMYTPTSRDIIIVNLSTITTSLSEFLNTNIANGNLSATVFVPNIIDFDTSLAKSQSDFAKLNECYPGDPTTTTNSMAGSIIWLLIIIFIIVLLAFSLIQLGPKYPTENK